MNNADHTIKAIKNRLMTSSSEIRLDDDDKAIICKALESFNMTDKNPTSTTYELLDMDALPIGYVNIAACYPEDFIMKQINQCIHDKADEKAIKQRLAETCGAVEVDFTHLLIHHTE